MIKVKEVSGKAVKAHVNDLQIEKDYVLSWILWGIANTPFLKENLLFRGASLLKKVYFPNYRFAEELEFTCKEVFELDKIKNAFSELVVQVQKKSGLALIIRGDIKDTATTYNFGIAFSGLLGGITSTKLIRIDISKNEHVYFPVLEKEIPLLYSDLVDEKISLTCYSIDEVVAEKMRSLLERSESGDVYDVWYLLEMDGYAIEDCIFGFLEKTSLRNLDPKKLKITVEKKVQEFAKHWRDDLARQMKLVPDYHDVWRQLEKFWRRYEKFIAQ